MANIDKDNITFENVDIMWPNFSGAKTMYTSEGIRSFNITLTDEQKALAEKAGFNVKVHESKEEDGESINTLRVRIGWVPDYPQFNPKVAMVRNNSTIPLDEKTIGLLDGSNIDHADVELRPFHWKMPNGNTGVSPRLAIGYFYITVSRLEEKYENFTEAGNLDTIEFEKIQKQQNVGLVGAN